MIQRMHTPSASYIFNIHENFRIFSHSQIKHTHTQFFFFLPFDFFKTNQFREKAFLTCFHLILNSKVLMGFRSMKMFTVQGEFEMQVPGKNIWKDVHKKSAQRKPREET